jgi:hypothetical protein
MFNPKTLKVSKFLFDPKLINEFLFAYEITDSQKSTWPFPLSDINICHYYLMEYDNSKLFLEVHYSPHQLLLHAIKAPNINIICDTLNNQQKKIYKMLDDETAFNIKDSLIYLERFNLDNSLLEKETISKKNKI